MKAQSIITIAALLLATGCIAQAGSGTDESSSAEELNAQTAPAQPQAAIPAANARERLGVEAPRVKTPAIQERDENVELSGPNGNGDPGDPQDPGDPLEPDPHPWHSTTATITK
jgi:hypothetical protein